MERPAEIDGAIKCLELEPLPDIHLPCWTWILSDSANSPAQAEQSQGLYPHLHLGPLESSWLLCPPPFWFARSTNNSSRVRRIGFTATTSPPASQICSIVWRCLNAGTVILIKPFCDVPSNISASIPFAVITNRSCASSNSASVPTR